VKLSTFVETLARTQERHRGLMRSFSAQDGLQEMQLGRKQQGRPV